MLIKLLLIILTLTLLGAIPAWPHSQAWGYGPTSGILALILIVLLLLALPNRKRH